MARVPYLAPEALDPEARAVLERIAGDRGDLPNVYRTFANSPRLFVQTVALIETLWRDTKISRQLQELVILRVAQLTGSDYEWGRHRMLARRLGVPEVQMQELAGWRTSVQFDAREKAALAYSDAVVAGTAAPASVTAELERAFDAAELVELTWTAAFYSGLARYLAALGVELEPGFERLSGDHA